MLVYFIFLIFLGICFSVCSYFTFKLPYRNIRAVDGALIGTEWKKYLKVGMGFSAYLILLLIVYILYDMTNQYFLELTGLNVFMSGIFYGLLVASAPLVIVAFVIILMQILTDKKIKGALAKGFRPNDMYVYRRRK